jgi:hypothetical protein
MEPDDLLCSRNARPCYGRRLRLRLRLSTAQSDLGRITFNLDLSLDLPMRRAQGKINQPPSLKRERASLERSIFGRSPRPCCTAFLSSLRGTLPSLESRSSEKGAT